MFQDNYLVKETQIHSITIKITITSNSKQCLCPKCNTPSFKIHSTYIIKVADLPISTFKTTLYIISRKFFCTNQE
ncbi:transposase family protein [Caloramator sp. Dgby_cultured_2]|uniref:transposase family protein n=1 Tax=Caloramator sp. Dgby_cultured_2 TaxID=3029174 RepID=UPI00406CE5EE